MQNITIGKTADTVKTLVSFRAKKWALGSKTTDDQKFSHNGPTTAQVAMKLDIPTPDAKKLLDRAAKSKMIHKHNSGGTCRWWPKNHLHEIRTEALKKS